MGWYYPKQETPLKRIRGYLWGVLAGCQAVSPTFHGLPKLVDVVFHGADNGEASSA